MCSSDMPICQNRPSMARAARRVSGDNHGSRSLSHPLTAAPSHANPAGRAALARRMPDNSEQRQLLNSALSVLPQCRKRGTGDERTPINPASYY